VQGLDWEVKGSQVWLAKYVCMIDEDEFRLVAI
jgi:hypothetical protein